SLAPVARGAPCANERSADQAKVHARCASCRAVGVFPIPDHEAALRRHPEALGREQVAVGGRFEAAGAVGLAAGHDHVEWGRPVDRTELLARWIVADDGGAPAAGAKSVQLAQELRPETGRAAWRARAEGASERA